MSKENTYHINFCGKEMTVKENQGLPVAPQRVITLINEEKPSIILKNISSGHVYQEEQIEMEKQLEIPVVFSERVRLDNPRPIYRDKEETEIWFFSDYGHEEKTKNIPILVRKIEK